MAESGGTERRHMTNRYETRTLRVIDHIFANLDGDLSLDALAEVAAMSRFHWHRVYRAMTGETCAQSVRRIRLHVAASELARGDHPVGEIARSVGYEDRDSFDRAFQMQYGMSPVVFRSRGVPFPFVRQKKDPDRMYPVDIRDIPARRLIGLPHTGAYFRISEAFSRLDVIMAARGLYPQVRNMIAVFDDDISLVPEAELSSFAAFEVAPDLPRPDDLNERVLPAGPQAVLTFNGPYSNLPAAYDFLFGTWLPSSGREPMDVPSYELYLNTPIDTAPEDLVTEIHLPLETADGEA